MPYANPDDAKKWNRARYARDCDLMKAKATRHYHENREAISCQRKIARTSPERREKDAAAMRARHAKLRKEMITEYGGKCSCCGETEALFLELDHTNNDGSSHRKKIGRGSGVIYRDLKKRGWPKSGYQLLCANCNAGKARNGGRCPHHG